MKATRCHVEGGGVVGGPGGFIFGLNTGFAAGWRRRWFLFAWFCLTRLTGHFTFLMLFQFFSFILNLRVAHFRERKIMLSNISDTKIIHFGHGQTFGGTNGGAQTAKATFSHVNVKRRCIDPFGSSIGSLAYFFGCFDGYDIDAINRTNLCALVTHNTIVNLIVKPVSAIIGYGLHFVRILNRCNAVPIVKIIWVAYRADDLRPSRLDKMMQGNSQSC